MEFTPKSKRRDIRVLPASGDRTQRGESRLHHRVDIFDALPRESDLSWPSFTNRYREAGDVAFERFGRELRKLRQFSCLFVQSAPLACKLAQRFLCISGAMHCADLVRSKSGHDVRMRSARLLPIG